MCPRVGELLDGRALRHYRRWDQIFLHEVLQALDVSIAKHCRVMSVITPTYPQPLF